MWRIQNNVYKGRLLHEDNSFGDKSINKMYACKVDKSHRRLLVDFLLDLSSQVKVHLTLFIVVH